MGRDDGCFWISAADFSKYFAGVQICRDSAGWKHHSEDLRCHSGQITVLMLTVTGSETVTADICVHQKAAARKCSTRPPACLAHPQAPPARACK